MIENAFSSKRDMVDQEYRGSNEFIMGWTPLHYASHLGEYNLVEILIRTYESSSLNAGEPQNLNTPLMLACMQHKKNVIERLLLAGANCNLQNKRGETALHVLAKMKTQ